MKRTITFTIILAGLAVLCAGQYRSRVLPRKVVQLIEPSLTGQVSFEEALAKQRGAQEFTCQQFKFTQIGQLAWAGRGITKPQRGSRTPPSAGADYPITLHFATQEGLFMYNPDEHSLEQTGDLDVRGVLAAVALKQEAVAEAGCDIIVAGSVRKFVAGYGKKARRHMLLEAGQIAQNIQLQAVSLELGSVTVGAFDIRDVGRICKLPKGLEPIYIICAGYVARQARPRRAVLIIARENFRDEELFETKLALDEAGVETVIASSRTGVIKGMLGGTAEATVLVSGLRVDDYDAIIFVGGPGASEYFDSQVAWNIAREAADKRKVLAAICIAPTVLANAGVLNGVAATSFLSERDRLQAAGAKYTGAAVERDGLIITGRDPRAASLFGRAIADALAGR